MKRVFRLFPPRLRTVKAQQVASRYSRSAAGDIVVPLRLSSPTALLMPFEGFPTNFGDEPDGHKAPVLNLNKDFVDYLFARLSELGDESLLLKINLANSFDDQPHPQNSAGVLQTAIQRYFSHLENVRRQDLQRLVRDAVLLGLLGVAALDLSVFLDSRSAAADAGIGLLLFSQGGNGIWLVDIVGSPGQRAVALASPLPAVAHEPAAAERQARTHDPPVTELMAISPSLLRWRYIADLIRPFLWLSPIVFQRQTLALKP